MTMRDDRVAQTVLIVDDDLGFLFWLGEVLTRAGYRAIPAHSVEEATNLTRRLRVTADVVIVNPAVSGAAEWSRGNSRWRRPVIAAVEDTGDFRASLVGACAIGLKPGAPKACAGGAPDLSAALKPNASQVLRRRRMEWLATVQQVLEGREGRSAPAFPWASLN